MAGSPAIPYATLPLAASISFEETLDHELLDLLWFYDCVCSILPPAFGNTAAGGSLKITNTATGHITCAYDSIACRRNGELRASACADIITVSPLLHRGRHGARFEATLMFDQGDMNGGCAAPAISAKASDEQCNGLPGSASFAAPAKWLRQVFDTFDENKDGMLSMEELRRSLEKLGIETSEESIDSLVSHNLACKVDKKGLVSHDEFLFLYQGGSSCSPDDVEHVVDCKIMNKNAADEELLRDAFDVFDKDGDGFISPAELQSVLQSLGFNAAQELDECTDMIKKYDQDGDGQVDFEEFKDMLNLTLTNA